MSYDDLLEDMEGSLCGRTDDCDDNVLRTVPAGREGLAELEAYWREIRGAAFLPRRRDLDATRFASALPHAFILERVAPGIARVRTSGQMLRGHLGFEARGMPLSLLFTPEGRNRLRVWLDRCFDGPALVDLPLTAWRGALHPPATGRLLLMPLLDHEGKVTRAVGGVFLDRAMRMSRVRFDVNEAAGVRHEKLRPAAWPVLAAAGEPRIRELAEPRRPFLRLVVSNP
ncbi:PAS domain-containing protein [Rubellimicrobium roseum]|uniref:PAS domain-containing protein n=1 Tax=Rubellimicrobium roseum TaxID=687525 RepID=A0A5C4NB73_9RHOB|nr:PAS domain-containing protein [Rubellimicrobium roseum]TNC71953.1 PAS domain-containing protein [Rubellimicrobium roseum]